MAVDASRIAFALREYRSAPAVQDLTVQTRHPLATELQQDTLLRTEADASAFAADILALRKLDRWNWGCYIRQQNYPNLEVGMTLTIVYPRFGLSAGKNFIVKRLVEDSSALFYETTLFGPQ